MIHFILNQSPVSTNAPEGMLLLDFIRENQHLTGTKEACREGECGACTVLVAAPDGAQSSLRYRAVASCLIALGDMDGCHVVTIEGLDNDPLLLVQRLIIKHSASQCGFCTPGFILSLTGFCLSRETLSATGCRDALDGNLCRCTGYRSILRVVDELTETLGDLDPDLTHRVASLVQREVVPLYFGDMAERLKKLPSRETTRFPPRTDDAGDVIVMAGGTDLMVQRPNVILNARLWFLSKRSDLNYIRASADVVEVGGGVTIEAFRLHADVASSFPSMPSDLLLHSSTILRNRATLVGNFVNASPIGDISIIFLALGATLKLVSADGVSRSVALCNFFLDYKKIELRSDELIEQITIPRLNQRRWYHFEKVSNRMYLDIAAVNSAFWVQLDDKGCIEAFRLAMGGVGPIPTVLDTCPEVLGNPPSLQTARALAEHALKKVKPIDDIRGTASYKTLLLEKQIWLHVEALMDHLTSTNKGAAS